MSLDERLAAVERALTDDDVQPADLSNAAAVERRLDAVEERHDELERRLADLEAAVDALRGRVGADDADTRAVERTAELALATAREVETRLDEETPPPRPEPVVRDPTTESGLLGRLRDRL